LRLLNIQKDFLLNHAYFEMNFTKVTNFF
jgi:hypothetical protein